LLNVMIRSTSASGSTEDWIGLGMYAV
jgi:hypothetical protein